MRSYRELQLAHTTVCIRVDYNVPLHDDGTIADDSRIRASLETIQYALQQQARVVLCSHMGRPKGVDPKLSLNVAAIRLSELLGQPVRFVDQAVGEKANAAKTALKDREILILENLRFYPGEEKNDAVFAQQLATGIDVYIDDAFGSIHRAHASIDALPRLIAQRGVGALIEKELHALDRVMTTSELMLVMGGAKMSDKIEMLKNLLPKSTAVCVGGALANCFLKVRDIQVGKSVVDEESLPIAREILSNTDTAQKILLPIDGIVATSPDDIHTRIVHFATDRVAENEMILDIGPATRALFMQQCAHAQVIFWNGPLGLSEQALFAEGSREIARAIAGSSAYSVIGGGDTASAVHALAPEAHFSHVSTGGGASLEYLSGAPMPGLLAVQ